MRRGVALASLTALLLAVGWCARDARRRVRARAANDALHRHSAALVGPALCLRRGALGPSREAPGVAGARRDALGERAE